MYEAGSERTMKYKELFRIPAGKRDGIDQSRNTGADGWEGNIIIAIKLTENEEGGWIHVAKGKVQ
jgi:hypothetical protein